jgi:hypothetical protein
MIRKLLSVVVLLSLGACSSMPSGRASSEPADVSSSGPASSGMVCDATPVLSLVGKTLTPGLVEQARTQSHSGMTRVLRPGEVMTMEYNPARLNLIVGKDDRLITIHCG